MRILIDTNIFLRFLLNDIPQQADAVAEILKEAARARLELWANPMVIAEIVRTCESYYELPRNEIRDKVLIILNTPGLEIEDADLVAEAVILYAEKNVDFIDAYHAALGNWINAESIYSYDEKDFRKLGFPREEP